MQRPKLYWAAWKKRDGCIQFGLQTADEKLGQMYLRSLYNCCPFYLFKIYGPFGVLKISGHTTSFTFYCLVHIYLVRLYGLRLSGWNNLLWHPCPCCKLAIFSILISVAALLYWNNGFIFLGESSSFLKFFQTGMTKLQASTLTFYAVLSKKIYVF